MLRDDTFRTALGGVPPPPLSNNLAQCSLSSYSTHLEPPNLVPLGVELECCEVCEVVVVRHARTDLGNTTSVGSSTVCRSKVAPREPSDDHGTPACRHYGGWDVVASA